MPTTYLACHLANLSQREASAISTATALALPGDAGKRIFKPNQEGKEQLRHILLGSSGAIQQTIHLLHSLGYADSVLWTPPSPVRGQIVITSEQGEMMSLLRRSL